MTTTAFRLHRQEQVYYTLPTLSATTPAGAQSIPVTGWAASFDGGLTWIAAVAHPDLATAPAWLIRGPSYPGSGDTAVGTGTVITASATGVLIRLRDSPETDIEQADPIRLWP